jgi:hypothetical protein
VHDGHVRLGLVSEVRGDYRRAVEYYRKVIAFMCEHPNIYGPGFEDGYQQLIDRLTEALTRSAITHRAHKTANATSFYLRRLIPHPSRRTVNPHSP